MWLARQSIAYIKSMRLYYAFVTGIAGWVGVAFYQFLAPEQVEAGRNVLVLAMLFLAWGVNQIINDYLGLKEDRINAPNRPMVTGELNTTFALAVTVLFLAVMLVVTWFLNPWAVIPAVIGILLNVLYEYAKAWSLLGNVIFGLSIASCTVFGFLAAGPVLAPLFTTNRVVGVLLVALLNGLMTYYTYFKDYHGDKLADKRTFVVRHGIDVARYAGVAGAFLTAGALLFFIYIDWLPFTDILYPTTFFFCGMITWLLQIWTAYLYFCYPVGDKTHFSLKTNIRACVAGQATLIAMFNAFLALYLLIGSYILIGFFFDMYGDAKA